MAGARQLELLRGERGSFPASVTLWTVQRFYSEQVAAALEADPDSDPADHATVAHAAVIQAFKEAHPEMEIPAVVLSLGVAQENEDSELEGTPRLDPLQEAV